jgi:PTS system nitrogen regulatory IIA component
MDLEHMIACVGRSPEGVEFEALDSRPVHLFFLLFAPEGEPGAHLRALATISRLLKRPSVREELLAADSKEQIYEILTQQDGPNPTKEKDIEIVL